jgi:hypothetical protein
MAAASIQSEDSSRETKERDYESKNRCVEYGSVFCCGGSGICQRCEYGHLEVERGEVEVFAGNADTVAYEAAGDSVKVTVDGTDAAGKPAHNEWTGKFDGKDYPLTGDATADSRAYKKVNDHTIELTNKKDGKVTASGRIVVAADGKSRTVTMTATDPTGKKAKYTAVYDKQ